MEPAANACNTDLEKSKHFMYAFVCTACTTVHQKYADLQLHMEQQHGPVQQPSKRIFYECLLCPKKLICVAEIRLHAATHPKMRESVVYYYKCGTCNIVAYTKDKFAAHRETCGLTVSVNNGGRPSHKLIVKRKVGTNASAPQTVLIQAVDSKGNITFQRHLVRGKLMNSPNATVLSPVKILKGPNPVSIHKNSDTMLNTDGPKNFISSLSTSLSCKILNPQFSTNAVIKNASSLPNSCVINFVDANAECGNTFPINVTPEKNDSKIQAGSISMEGNESEFTAVFDHTEGNEKDPLSLEGMEPSKTTTSSCVVCGKFVERSLIRSEVQRVPVRCASCVAKSCYQRKPKNSPLLVVSPKSISSNNLQSRESSPVRKKRRLSLSSTNDQVKCRSCSCLMSSDYPVIQNHYKMVHNEELELIPELLDQKVNAVKEHTSSSTEEESNKTDKNNGVDQAVRNGSYVKKKKRKSLRTPESKSSTPSTQSVSRSDDVNDTADTEGNAKLDSVQKDLQEGYPCNYGSCQFSTDNINVFREHIITHRSGEYIYQCMECGYASKSGFSLSYHLMIKHGIVDVENYANDKKECYFGNESESSDYDSDYSWSESRLDSSNMDDVAENECRVCRETFDSSQELDQHIRTHGMAFLVHIRKNRNTVREKQAVQS